MPPAGGGVCGTEVPDPTELVYGCLVDEDGLPVPGFSVQAGTPVPGHYPGVDSGAIRMVDSSTTDSLGRFSFRKLETGRFYISAQEGSLRSMRTRLVERHPGDTAKTRLGKNTLFRNGLIQGILRAEQDGSPLPFVVCEVVDRPYAAKSGEDGRFNLFLPPGRATLECGANRGDMNAARAIFEAVAGETDTLTLSLSLKDDDDVRPQAPAGLSYRYDAATGIVHLSWPAVASAPGGILYVIKRTDLTVGQHAYTTFFTSDTFHADVIPWPRDEDGVVRAEPKTILYNVGTSFSNKITYSRTTVDTLVAVDPPLFLGPEVEVKILGDTSVFTVGDTARLVGTWRNRYRGNRHLAWTLDADGSPLKPRREPIETAGADTLAYVCAAPGNRGIRFKVTDLSGAAVSLLQVIEIKPAP